MYRRPQSTFALVRTRILSGVAVPWCRNASVVVQVQASSLDVRERHFMVSVVRKPMFQDRAPTCFREGPSLGSAHPPEASSLRGFAGLPKRRAKGAEGARNMVQAATFGKGEIILL